MRLGGRRITRRRKTLKWLLQGDNQGRLSGGNKWIGKQQEAKERKTEEENEIRNDKLGKRTRTEKIWEASEK
jgi:hypothetical protein